MLMLLLLEEAAVAFLVSVVFLLAAFAAAAVVDVVLLSDPLLFVEVAASLFLFLFLFGLARYLLTRPVSLFLSRQSSTEACVFVDICCPVASVADELDPVNPVRLFWTVW